MGCRQTTGGLSTVSHPQRVTRCIACGWHKLHAVTGCVMLASPASCLMHILVCSPQHAFPQPDARCCM
jgi:hypothetical protein